jgi:BppU N-terminal domain/Pectate lyase superfamily protein/Right handed beta helix region
MNKTFDITLDLEKAVQNPIFTVNTNDLRTVQLDISVVQDDRPVDLTDANVRIAIIKPDRKTIFQEVDIIDAELGLCEVVLDTQAYIVPGKYTAELMIYFVGERVAVTGHFKYQSVRGILDDETVESVNSYQALNKIVIDAEKHKLDAEKAAQNAKQSEDNAKVSEQNAQTHELEAKQAEDNAKNAAANAAQDALVELEVRTEQFYEQKVAELQAPIDDLSEQLTNLDQQKLSKDSLPYVFVDLFGAKGDGVTDDTQAIQNAIDSVYEKSALVFRAGGKYRITSTITVDASKIRMLKGFNSYIMVDGDFDGIHYKGNKTFVGTAPDENVNILKYDEIFNIVQGIQFYGTSDPETGFYRGRGLVIEDQHSPVVTDCHFFNLDHGLEIRGMNTRNIVISNTNFWDNRTSGLYFSGGEVHQCVIANCHISYSKYSVYIDEGYNMYNLHISNCDMEAQINQNEPFRSFLHFLGTNSEILISNTTLQAHKIEGVSPDNLAYFENVGRLLLNGCYFAHSYGDGIHIESGSCVIINGCLMENVSGDGIIINNASDVQINSNVFYDIGGSCIKSGNGIDRFNIEANRATDVGVYIDIYNNGKSFLDSSISNNLIRPKIAPAIKMESSLNARNLIISNNSIYWATDTYDNPTQYAVDVKVVQASGLIFKNNVLNARSNNSTQGINGFKVKGVGNLYGLILKDNIVDQIRKSAGRVDFDFNDPNSEILISDNLSVREV